MGIILHHPYHLPITCITIKSDFTGLILLPLSFDFSDGGLIAVTLFYNAKQSFIKLQTLSPGKRLWNRRHFAVSQQT